MPLPLWADEAYCKVAEMNHGVLTIVAPRREGAAPFPQTRRLTVSYAP